MNSRIPSDCEDRLHLLLGRLVHAFARFDFSMGLQLKWLGPYRGIEVETLLVPQQPFHQRLKALRPLVLETYGYTSEKARMQFEGWFSRALEFKALRNDYVHGRWHFQPHWRSDGDTVQFSPLSWDMDPATQLPAAVVSLKAFQTEVEEIEALFSTFWDLETRHRSQARPSAAWEAEQAALRRSTGKPKPTKK